MTVYFASWLQYTFEYTQPLLHRFKARPVWR